MASFTLSSYSLFVPGFIRNFIHTIVPEQKKAVDAPAAKAKIRTAAQVYKDTELDGKILLLRPAPKIRNLVLPGGGASGWVMPRAIARLGKPFFDEVRQISGCSCGSLVALLLGAGMSPQELDAKLGTISIHELFESISDFGTRYPTLTLIPEGLPSQLSSMMQSIMRMLVMNTFAKGWQKTAQRFVELLDQWSTESVSNHLRSHEIWDKVHEQYKANQLGPTPEENEKNWLRLNELRDSRWITGSTAPRTQQMITFSDNALLHQIDPALFKKVTIVTSKVTDNSRADASAPLVVEQEICNAENMPYRPIVDAGRCSMSLALYCQAVAINGQRYMDGGLTSRNPAEIFYSADKTKIEISPAEQSVRAETLLFMLVSASQYNNEVHDILYKKPSKSISATLLNLVAQWFLNCPQFAQRAYEDNLKWYEAGPNVAVIYNGKLKTFDIYASQQKIDDARQLADRSIDQYIEQHKNEAWSVAFNSVQEAVDILSEAEKIAVKEAGHPELEPGFDSLPLHVREAQIDFYREIIAHLEVSRLLERISVNKVC